MTRYLLDTKIVLRAANKSSSQHPATVHSMSALTGQGRDLAVTPQVLIERCRSSWLTVPEDLPGKSDDDFYPPEWAVEYRRDEEQVSHRDISVNNPHYFRKKAKIDRILCAFSA
jgi:hypothetical protein